MRRTGVFLMMAALLGLAACQDSGLDLAARSERKIVVGRNITLAMVSLDGLPDTVTPRFSAALAEAAQARDMAFIDAADKPRFRLRGYLSAYSGEGGTSVSYVWDVFDASLNRARRVAGSETLSRRDADPWAAMDEAALRRIAGRSLDGVGEFLISQPQESAPVAARPGL